MLVVTAATLFFAVGVTSNATPLYLNSTTTSSHSSTSRTSSFSSVTTSPSNHSSSNSSGHNETITGSAYYNPYSFVNPYYYRALSATGEALSSLMSCSSIWRSDFSTWSLTAEKTTGPIVAKTTQTTLDVGYITTHGAMKVKSGTKTTTIPKSVETVLPQTNTITSAEMGPLYLAASSFDFTASKPCCYGCTISGGTVQVFYWPTETQSPPLSTLINADGFTLTSPSIYVAFETLHASNLCGDVGSKITTTTLAFAPGELSTSAAYLVESSLTWNVLLDHQNKLTWTKATFGDITDCQTTVTTNWGWGAMAYTDYTSASSAASSMLEIFPMPGWKVEDLLSTYEWTLNPCKPTVSVPSQILTLNPAWSNCAAPVTAFYDPPFALSQGNGFNTNAPVVSSAAPVQAADLAIAHATTTSAPTSTTPSATPTAAPSTSHVEVQPVKILTPADPSSSSASDALAGNPASNPAPVSSDPGATGSAALGTQASNTEGNAPVPNGAPASNQNPSQNPTSQLPVTVPSPSAAVLNFGSSAITADKSSNLVIASQTLTPGGGVTVSGTHVSLASNGAYVVLDGQSTQSLATAPSQAAVLNFGSSAITADKSFNLVFASQTLTPGGGVTVSGTHLSLASNGAYVVLDGQSTQSLVTATPQAAVLNMGFSVITADKSSNIVFGSQTLPAGSAATLSLASNGAYVVMNGQTTQALATAAQASALEYIISSQTLRQNGAAITVAGTVMSLLPGASSVVVGSKTVPVGDLAGVTTTAAPMGNAIISVGGFGALATGTGSGNGSGSGSYNGTMFLGGASGNKAPRCILVLELSIGLGVLGVMLL